MRSLLARGVVTPCGLSSSPTFKKNLMFQAAEFYEMSVSFYWTTLARKQQLFTHTYLLHIYKHTTYVHIYWRERARAHTHARTRTHTRARAHTHTRTRTRTHTHTHTPTQSSYVPVQGPVLIPQHKYDS